MRYGRSADIAGPAGASLHQPAIRPCPCPSPHVPPNWPLCCSAALLHALGSWSGSSSASCLWLPSRHHQARQSPGPGPWRRSRDPPASGFDSLHMMDPRHLQQPAIHPSNCVLAITCSWTRTGTSHHQARLQRNRWKPLLPRKDRVLGRSLFCATPVSACPAFGQRIATRLPVTATHGRPG